MTAPTEPRSRPMREEFTDIVGAALDADPRLSLIHI